MSQKFHRNGRWMSLAEINDKKAAEKTVKTAEETKTEKKKKEQK